MASTTGYPPPAMRPLGASNKAAGAANWAAKGSTPTWRPNTSRWSLVEVAFETLQPELLRLIAQPTAGAALPAPLPALGCDTFCPPPRWAAGGTTEQPRCVPEVARVSYCGCCTCEADLGFYGLTMNVCVTCLPMPLTQLESRSEERRVG